MNFNPRTHKGCDSRPDVVGSDIKVFQSTHPQGVRLYSIANFRWGVLFQSTHPQGVRLWPQWAGPRTSGTFQSTHPQGVRPVNKIEGYNSTIISIHAPTRGATLSSVDLSGARPISIHAPTRGATSNAL